MEETRGTYRVKVCCRNCKWEGTQEIEKGTLIDILVSTLCPICGCNGLYSLGISRAMSLTDDQWNQLKS